MPGPLSEAAVRGARLSRLPGITLAEASARTGARIPEIRRAREVLGVAARSGREDLVVAALTDLGRTREGAVGDLARIAAFVDWQDHDGCTAADVARALDALVVAGVLEVRGDRFRLRVEWPSGAP